MRMPCLASGVIRQVASIPPGMQVEVQASGKPRCSGPCGTGMRCGTGCVCQCTGAITDVAIGASTSSHQVSLCRCIAQNTGVIA